jgi:hypothetical protein
MKAINVVVAGGHLKPTDEAVEMFKAIMAMVFRQAAANDIGVCVHVSHGFPGDGLVGSWCKAVHPKFNAWGDNSRVNIIDARQWRGAKHTEIQKRNDALLGCNPKHIIVMPGGKGLWRFVADVKSRGLGDRLILIDKAGNYEEAA